MKGDRKITPKKICFKLFWKLHNCYNIILGLSISTQYSLKHRKEITLITWNWNLTAFWLFKGKSNVWDVGFLLRTTQTICLLNICHSNIYIYILARFWNTSVAMDGSHCAPSSHFSGWKCSKNLEFYLYSWWLWQVVPPMRGWKMPPKAPHFFYTLAPHRSKVL